MGPGPLWDARNADNSRNPPTPHPNPRPGAEISQSWKPLTGIIILLQEHDFWKKHFLKKTTFYMITQAQNQDENDRKWII